MPILSEDDSAEMYAMYTTYNKVNLLAKCKEILLVTVLMGIPSDFKHWMVHAIRNAACREEMFVMLPTYFGYDETIAYKGRQLSVRKIVARTFICRELAREIGEDIRVRLVNENMRLGFRVEYWPAPPIHDPEDYSDMPPMEDA